MEQDNDQFDGREALAAGNALRIRSPSKQKKRIRRDYAEKVRDLDPESVTPDIEEDSFSARRDVTKKEDGQEPESGDTAGDLKYRKKNIRKKQVEKFNGRHDSADSIKRNAFRGTDDGERLSGDDLSGKKRARCYGRRSRFWKDKEPVEGKSDGNRQHFFTDEVKARRYLEETSENGKAESRGNVLPDPRNKGTGRENSAGNRIFAEMTGPSGSLGNKRSADSTKLAGGFTENRIGGMKDVSHFSSGRTTGTMSAGHLGDAFYAAGTGGAGSDPVIAAGIQKKQLRRAYVMGENRSLYIPILSNIQERRAHARVTKESEKGVIKALQAMRRHPAMVGTVILVMVFVLFFSAIASAGTAFIGEVAAPAVMETSYSAEDDDIHGAEEDYLALEAELREKADDLESNYPGYENYSLKNTEIGHDPYRLMALLTVLHERFTRSGVQVSLKKIFNAQYAISSEDITGTTEQKTVRIGESLGTVVTSGYCNCAICCDEWAGGPTSSGVYPVENHTLAVDIRNPIVPEGTRIVMNGTEYTVEDTGNLERYGVAFDVYYEEHEVAQAHGHQNWEAFIADDNGTETVTVNVTNTRPTLRVTLKNYGIDHAARELLNDDEYSRYQLMAQLKGNREGLFPGYDAATAHGGLNYAPPGSALSDVQFANMYYEAIKYLGIEYVWGGESPETGFDCSGFVSYVINHCGNGWNYGRLTAEEWRQTCFYVPPSEARPGDLIFFQGTYNTDGASHIGIYLGEGMMIHAGHPVQIASCESPFFREHFLSYGRIPG